MWHSRRVGWNVGLLVTCVMLLAMGLWLLPTREAASEAPEIGDSTVEPAADVVATATMDVRLYLPLIMREYGPRASRFGFCATRSPIHTYADIRKLFAGWYLDFTARATPSRPLGMEYVQVVRIHQLTTCWPQRTRNRTTCPYVTPYDYVIYSPAGGKAEIQAIARANPGALWFIGNEMDRRDWEGGGQDEMLPEYYAVVYHELYHLIKAADPTAKVAIGGIVQATPVRMQYLDKIWNTYRNTYGVDMPVDVWNVHNFIFKERCNDYGADVPPGYHQCDGTLYADTDHNSMVIFKHQIQVFREWMKARGQQQKPLIVSEYGIVYFHAGMENFALVRDFMKASFDYFLNARDCNLGYAADNCRLVQRWAWYSLDDKGDHINKYAHLIDPNTGRLTPLGEVFASYTQRYLDTR